MRAVGCVYACVHACDKDWRPVLEANSLCVAVLLMCLSCFYLQSVTWRKPSGGGWDLLIILLLLLPIHPSTHPSLHPSLAYLHPPCELSIMTQYAPTAHSPLLLTKDQERCIEMNSLPHRDPIHQLQHHTDGSTGQHPPRQCFKGTGVTDIQIHTIFMTIVCIFTQGLRRYVLAV